MGTGMSLLPDWMRLVWVVAFAGVVAVHVGHAWAMRGQRRIWHATHALMALGMIAMFASRMISGVARTAWEVVFAVSAAGVAAWVARGPRPINGLWAISIADLVAMVYMFALPGAAVSPLTYALAGYFGAEAVAWITRLLGDTGRWQGTLALPASGSPAQAPASPVGPASSVGLASPISLAGRASLGLRATLAIMATGMAYMFAAMQAGH